MIAGRAGQVVGLVHDRGADREATRVQRPSGIREPRCEAVTVLDVDVLDVELDAPVAVSSAQFDERGNRS